MSFSYFLVALLVKGHVCLQISLPFFLFWESEFLDESGNKLRFAVLENLRVVVDFEKVWKIFKFS